MKLNKHGLLQRAFWCTPAEHKLIRQAQHIAGFDRLMDWGRQAIVAASLRKVRQQEKKQKLLEQARERNNDS